MGSEGEVEMETYIITHGIKVLACLFGFLGFLLLITATGGTAWVVEDVEEKWETYGLFEKCEVASIPEDLHDKKGTEEFECALHEVVPTWLLACQVLMVLSIFLAFVSFICIAVGLCSASEGCKFNSYKVGIYGYFVIVLNIILTSIIFPIKFFQDNTDENLNLDWAYGLSWGLAVLFLAGALMMVLDKGDELGLREKIPEEEEEDA